MVRPSSTAANELVRFPEEGIFNLLLIFIDSCDLTSL